MTGYRGMVVILLLVLIVTGCAGRSGTPGGGSPSGAAGGTNGQSSAGGGGADVQPPADGSGGAGNAAGSGESEPAPADPVRDRTGKLSTDEKIGQLVLVGMDGTEIGQNARDLIEKEHVGGFIFYKDNIQDKAQALALFNALKAANREQPVPLFLSVDEEGGRVSRMPGEFAKLPAMRAIGDTGSEEPGRANRRSHRQGAVRIRPEPRFCAGARRQQQSRQPGHRGPRVWREAGHRQQDGHCRHERDP